MNVRSPLVRLVALYCILLLLLGAGFAWFTMRSFTHYISTTTLRNVDARAGEIWHTMRGVEDRRELARLIELRFAPEAQNRFIRITRDGNTLYESAVPAETDLAALYAWHPVAQSDGEGHLFGSLLVTSQTFEAHGHRITVESGQSEQFSQGVGRRLLQSLLFGLPVLLALAALGGYVLMRQALKPVENMIDAAEAITFNNPGNRLPLARTGDRIETLGLALNRMLDRLDNAYQYANRFSVDAAHELRTPLAIIRGELEYLNGQDVPEAMRDGIRNTLSEVVRLTDLVENLGLLSSLDSLWGKHAHTEFDLFALAEETIEQMRLLADEKGVGLLPVSGTTASVAGDRSRLKQVIVNLIDNAVKYTPQGGRVFVNVSTEGNRAQVAVTDSGIGIAPEHHEQIFRRFFRLSADRGETGSGLGLSIARSICAAHGGALSVESAAGSGSTFLVDLPLSAQARGERTAGRTAKAAPPRAEPSRVE